MKNKKGFTIVELIAVIVILALIAIMIINNYSKTIQGINKEKQTSADSALDEALDVYYHLGINNNDLKYYKEDEKIITCIKMSSLIAAGYLAEEDYLVGDYKQGDTLKITVDAGNITYKKITNTSECDFNEINASSIYDGNTASSSGDSSDVDSYTFNQDVSMVDVNVFSVDIDFTFKALMQITQANPESYIIMILDRSGSMGGTRIYNANAAVTNLSKTVAKREGNDFNICLAFISMGFDVTLDQPFTNQPFTANAIAYGAENYTHSLNFAYDLFFTPNSGLPKSYSHNYRNGIEHNYGSYWGGENIISTIKNPTNSVPDCANRLTAKNKIVLFMSDGYPEMAFTVNTMYGAANQLKNAGVNLVTYGYTTSSDRTILKNIASSTCGTDKKQPCYYDSDVQFFDQQLQDFALNAINELKESRYKQAGIDLELNTKYFTCEKGSEQVGVKCVGDNKVTIDIDLAGNITEDGMIIGDFGFNIKYLESGNKYFPAGQSIMEVPIFTAGSIKFYKDRDTYLAGASPEQTVTINNLPKILITKRAATALN